MAEVAATRTSFVGTTIAQGITEFGARLSKIDPNLAAAVKNGSVQVVDSIIYGTRAIAGSTTTEVFQASDAKEVGLTNINKRQLEANTYFLLTGIQVLVAESSNATGADADCKTASFVPISKQSGLKAFANGELELKNGDKVIMPRNSMEIFNTDASNTDEIPGFYKLDCPKLISPLTDIVPWLYLPTGITATNMAKALVKIVLYGVKTNKA